MAPFGRPPSVVAMELGSGIAFEGGAMRCATTRELAARESDGIHVLLLWHSAENAVSVSVEDARLDDRFEIAVAPDRALDAFYHPYAYAA
jgi:hypothetical protein